MKRLLVLAAGVAAAIAPGSARAYGTDCFYDGKKEDDRYGRPKNFTGAYTCKDRDTGKVVSIQHYVDGRQDGDYAKYDSRTGKIDEAGHYRAGELDGVLRRYKDGVPYLEYNYAGGKRKGVQRELKDGVVSRAYLVDAEGRPDTDYSLNKNGQPTMLECGSRPIGDKDAAWCSFDGKPSTVTLYDDQGRPRATRQYLRGKSHGLSRKLNVVTGAVMEETRYEDGKRLEDGQRYFDRSGALASKTDCDDKRVTCTETLYYEGGKQVQQVTVRRDRRTTLRTTEYYQNGKTRRDMIAEGDKLRITSYYDTGQVEEKGTYLEVPGAWSGTDTIPDGVVESYRQDGALATRESYVRGRRQGPSLRTTTRDGRRVREEEDYDQGKLVRQKVYVDDVLTEESEFFPDGSIKSRREHKAGSKI